MSTSTIPSINQKGLAPILIVLILAALVSVYFIYQNQSFQPSPITTGGIAGTVKLSPTKPGPCRENETCTKPYQTTVIVKTTDGSKEIARFTSDENGQFHVKLTPGVYLLKPISGGSYPKFPICSSPTVKVEPNKFTETIISCDTGMR